MQKKPAIFRGLFFAHKTLSSPSHHDCVKVREIAFMDTGMTEQPLKTVNDSAITAASCYNCGQAANGQYCSACGVRLQVSRISFSGLFGDARTRILNFEHGLFLTLKTLLLRPTRVIEDYLNGNRERYNHPFTLLFVTATLNYLVTITWGDVFWREVRQQLEKSAQYRHFSPEQLEKAVSTIVALNSTIAYWMLLLTLPTALIMKIAFRSLRYNIAEYWVICLFATAMGVLLDALMSLIFFNVNAPYILTVNSFAIANMVALIYICARTFTCGGLRKLWLFPIGLFMTSLATFFIGNTSYWVARLL